MSTPTPTFGTQIIGQTEKALNAILDRQLAGTELTERQWVALTLAVIGGGTDDRASFSSRVAGALQVSDIEAQALIAELSARELLDLPDAEDAPVGPSEAGRQLHARIRTTIAGITKRLWGDLPSEDLTVAGRVLGTVLERANAELARG
jgi:hypothetical protein